MKKKIRFPLVGYNDKRHVIKGYDKVDNYIYNMTIKINNIQGLFSPLYQEINKNINLKKKNKKNLNFFKTAFETQKQTEFLTLNYSNNKTI